MTLDRDNRKAQAAALRAARVESRQASTAKRPWLSRLLIGVAAVVLIGGAIWAMILGKLF